MENQPTQNSGLPGVPADAELKEGPTVEVQGAPESTALETAVPETLILDPEELEEAKPSVKPKKKAEKKNIIEAMGNISVRPYVDATVENMGLENYGMVVYPGTHQEESLAAIERNGVVRYVTGLDEYAPEVQNLPEEQREAVIANIRFIVSTLEKQLATNMIEMDDPEFWNKVQLLRPDNHEFWAKVSLRCGNETLFLQPKKDPYDLLKVVAIEAGGFDLIAKSYEDAQTKMKPPKWYLDKEINTVATRTEYKKLKNKAISILDKLFGKSPKKLLYVAKVLDLNSTQYKNSTPQDTVYDNLDEYINGHGVEGNKTRAADEFIKATELDMETLKLKAIVKDAAFYKFIVTKPDGMIYHSKSSAVLGRNVSDVVVFLKNPLNEDVLKDLLGEVEQYWNQ
jgi:hypothetical protein